MLHTWTIGPITFDTGAGGQTITTELPLLNLGRAETIALVLKVTKADTDANDTLDVYFDETFDRVTWDNRGRFQQITGDMSPSATAPEVRKLVISSRIALDATEESYETSGSAGGSDLAAGTVRNGPFAPIFRNTAGIAASHRLRFVVADPTGSNADFEGSVTLSITSPM